VLDVREPVALSFGLKYLNSFAKAAPLASAVQLCMSDDLPIMINYQIEDMGHVRFYLAPKIDDDNEQDMADGAGGEADGE
jgi:proliferating cell nuclear antigen